MPFEMNNVHLKHKIQKVLIQVQIFLRFQNINNTRLLYDFMKLYKCSELNLGHIFKTEEGGTEEKKKEKQNKKIRRVPNVFSSVKYFLCNA